MNGMESIQTRRNTFITGARVKIGKKTTVFRWPHPTHYGANPDSLADAGFYFTPSPDDRDCVRCFACGKELSEWDPDDNPYAIHYQKCGSTCPWAIVRCGLETERDNRGRYKFTDADRIPNSEHMENARLATFGDQWPHDDVKGHGANSEKMAKAGFCYTPTPDSNDTVTCHYCLTTLNHWGASDHPLEDHRKSAQAKDCPFIALFPSVKSSRASSRPAARGRKSVRASSRAPSTSESAVESEVDLGRSTLGRSTRKRQKVATSDTEGIIKKSTKKPSKSTKVANAEVQEPTPPSSKLESTDVPTQLGRSTRGRTRVEVAREEPITVLTKPVRKGAKSEANGRAASIAPSETDRTDSDSAKPALGRSTRQRSKAIVKEEEEELSVVTPKPKRRTGRSVAPAREADEDVPPKRRSTRASSIARSVADETDEDTENVTVAPPKRGRPAKKSVAPVAPTPKLGKKATTRQGPVAPVASEEAEADIPAPKANPPTRGKSVSKAAPVEGSPEPEPPAKRSRTRKSTRARSHSVAHSTEEEDPAVDTKLATRLGKSTSKRSVVQTEGEPEPSTRPGISRKSVRGRSQSVAPAEEEPMEVEEVTKGKKQKVATSRSVKAQKRMPEPASETEDEAPPVAPRRRAPSRARSRPPSEDVEMAPPKKVVNKARGTSRQPSSTRNEQQAASRPPSRLLNQSRSKPPTPEQSDSEQARPARRTRAKSRGPSPAPSEPHDEPWADKQQRRGRSRGPSVAPDADDANITPLPPAKDHKPSRMRSLSKVRPPLASQSFQRAEEVPMNELNLMEADSEPESPSPEKPQRSKPASLGRPPLPPIDMKGKGKAKIPATPAAKPPPPHQHTARKLQTTFQVVKAHEDSDMDSDAKSPQPMTPAPVKVRLTTPESALTEDESFQQASSPSPVKPRRSHRQSHEVDDAGDYSMFDGEAHQSLRDETTVILAHPMSKGTPSMRRSSATSQPLANQAARPSRVPSPDMNDDADESVIDIRSDEETRAFKLQPRPQLGPSHVTSKPSASILKTSKPPSISSRNPPSKLPAQAATEETSKPPKLPTKQEAARAQEASKAQVQALRTRFTSPAPATKASAIHSTDTPRNATSRVANGNVEAPSKALGQGQVPQPPSAALPPWMMTPHAFPTSLTEEERAMTVEDWIRKQAMNERDRFKRDAEEYIRAFEEKAAETRATIETRIGA